jgi:putative addiction module component (TIGR02574 family)
VAQTSVDLDALTVDEQLELLDRIWERLSRNPADLPLPPEQARELDARDDELEADVRAGRPLGEPWSEARKRFK